MAFDFRTRRSLKGIAEPMTIYAVALSAAAWAPQHRRSMRRRWLLGGTVVVAIAIVGGAAAWIVTRPPPGLPPGPWTIGLDAPLTGDLASGGILVRDAAQLAIDEVDAAGGIGGSQLVLDARDDTFDPDKGAVNTAAFIADPKTVAMIGPWDSGTAVSEIPLTNAAGLLQCSPSNTLPQMTKPRDGALDLRASYPDRINYIRTAPADDIQGPALASFVFGDLGAKRTLVIDDGDFGKDIADQFSAAYRKLGGLVVKRTLNPGADPAAVLEPLTGADAPTAVFFGGFTDTGAVDVRLAMVVAGKAAVPFVSWDDGRVFDRMEPPRVRLFVPRVGGHGCRRIVLLACRCRAAKGRLRRTLSSALPRGARRVRRGRICLRAGDLRDLRAVALTGPSASDLREAMRAHAVDPTHRFETVIGTIGFDANGDSLQQFVTFYRVDPSAAGGKGDWVIYKQQDYGPAR